ncbi:glycosyltransferase family 2 protein [Pontibacter pamirensis]|uniref:glycosyltransferase family 2 protein n=1 Tax=Pontibacter pamirensis TaxID=2562824 RepID=UPI001F46D6F5|nr:glycosyltransferase [Pontibacter pamirensis]
MIPVYNCADYIPEALHSVLAQCIGEEQMQIEVVDDASTDADVEAIVREIGGGRVAYHRQPENVGSLRNFETCINRARGRLVHLLHGDDRVKQGFYRKIAFLFEQFPAAGAAFCRYSFIDKTGNWSHNTPREAKKDTILNNWFVQICKKQRIQYASMVVRREVYEHLGSFYGMPYGEDWEMWVRIARYYSIAYTPEILAEYRLLDDSMSNRMESSGQSLFLLLKSRALIQEHILQERIPESIKKNIIAEGKKHCALYCIALASNIHKKTHNRLLAKEYIITALHLSKKPSVVLRVLKFCLKLTLMKFSARPFTVLGILNHYT